MCGIAGAVALNAGYRPDPDRVRRMTAMIEHRGPDAGGFWESGDGRVVFGHRRLAVIDLAGGQQPMQTSNGDVLTFNGEIYNYIELREELRREGVVIEAASDTAVLLTLLQRRGKSCLSALRGMFAFAFWDTVRKELILARDPVGKKPLYYMIENGCIYFASTFNALAKTSPQPARIDLQAVDAFLDLGYIPAPLTIDNRIFKLAAGTILTARHEVRTTRYDSIDEPHAPYGESFERAVDDLDALVTEATAMRMRSDVPLAVFLSGGIDSSLVAAVAARQTTALRTFSIGFDDARYDETRHAEAVAQHIRSDHVTFRVRPDLMALLPDMVRHFGEPFADATALPTFILSEETRRHVTVVLSGDGGDEGFGGYPWYQTAARLKRMRALVPAGMLSGQPGRIGRAASLLRLDNADRYAALRSFIHPHEARSLYAGDLATARQSAMDGSRRLAAHYRNTAGSDLNRMRSVDLTSYLADCLLPKTDVSTMAFALEARAPLLDREVLRFAQSLPDHWLIRKGSGKLILRKLLDRYLPNEIMQRPKQGFSLPLREWFLSAHRDSIQRLASDRTLLDTGWFDTTAVSTMVNEHVAQRRDHSQRIFNLLVLREWLAQQ